MNKRKDRCDLCRRLLWDEEAGKYKSYTQRFREFYAHHKIVCENCMVKEKQEDIEKEKRKDRSIQNQKAGRLEKKKQKEITGKAITDMNKICGICKKPIITPKMIIYECQGTDETGKVITEKFYEYEHHKCSGIVIINAEISDE